MTEPSVEDIVARFERTATMSVGDTVHLIASWRERGEALEDVLKFSSDPGVIKFVRAALKAKP